MKEIMIVFYTITQHICKAYINLQNQLKSLESTQKTLLSYWNVMLLMLFFLNHQ